MNASAQSRRREFRRIVRHPITIVVVAILVGAISGVLAAYLLLFPWARVTVIVPLGIIPYPLAIAAMWVIGFWFLLQLISAGLANPGQPGTAWWAHVGGFVAGLILGPLLVRSEQRYRLYYPDEGTLGFDTRGQI